ncbi:ribose-5-phosphate isomerase RpiA [Rubrobacter indicoceani]|uniref:ribose-5-phosphate isomerase RpiA n=1 Tax=Rubrobacter indicoceani TaxID=2051957 RepID=UPI000E5BC327|nr:ribose-5-phosphate isomerase RpiA [Rubrobacter indicoceani]
MSQTDDFKRDAGYAAVDRFVESGMTVGLGTGSTAEWVVRRISQGLESGSLKKIIGVPTSERTAQLAGELGVPMTSLARSRPDVVLDGADEISPAFEAIKGLGGALLREKIVAASSGRSLVLVADETKPVEVLGKVSPVPVEVEIFGWEITAEDLASLGCTVTLRFAGEDMSDPYITDGGHYTLDCRFDGVTDPEALETEIKRIPGALECGLFVGLTKAAVVAGENGVVVTERC